METLGRIADAAVCVVVLGPFYAVMAYVVWMWIFKSN
jgi:hypothetical protein